jgi:hypothetical protein
MGEWRLAVTFMASALDGGEWSASSLCRFPPGDTFLGALWIEGWMNPRAGLDVVGIETPLSNP